MCHRVSFPSAGTESLHRRDHCRNVTLLKILRDLSWMATSLLCSWCVTNMEMIFLYGIYTACHCVSYEKQPFADTFSLRAESVVRCFIPPGWLCTALPHRANVLVLHTSWILFLDYRLQSTVFAHLNIVRCVREDWRPTSSGARLTHTVHFTCCQVYWQQSFGAWNFIRLSYMTIGEAVLSRTVDTCCPIRLHHR